MKFILETIFKNANVKVEDKTFEEPFSAIKRLLRYYREDIPAKPRYLYDADAVYFYNIDNIISKIGKEGCKRNLAERGDIMTSFWTPLVFYLYGSKLPKNNDNIDCILKEDSATDIFQLMDYLAKNYVSRGNLLLLPNSRNSSNRRNLNNDKFSITEDKLDKFLYFCMEGKLKVYFNNDIENVRDWVLVEHLECLFSQSFFEKSLQEIEEGNVVIDIKREDIKADNIQSLVNSPLKIREYKYRDFSNQDWHTYFERLNKIIAYRNVIKIKSYLPLTWEKVNFK